MTSRTEPRAFTLIELLLVLAIIAVISAVTAPTFVRSMRGNRLRTAADQVVRAGRYARSMAVMRQQPMLLSFDLESATMAVTPSVLVKPDEEEDGTDSWDDNRTEPDHGSIPGPDEQPASAAGFNVAVVRKLDKVRFDSVEISGGEEEIHSDGKCAITYRNNGTCTPYVVKIVDEFDTVVTITVDALSGAETEREEGFE